MMSDDLVKRLRSQIHQRIVGGLFSEAADRIEELEAQNRELALEIISANGQALDAYDAQKDAEQRAATLEAERNKYESAWLEAEGKLSDAEQRNATLEERYLAVVGDKINLRGEVATLKEKLAKADAWQEAVFAAHPNIDLDIETKENGT